VKSIVGFKPPSTEGGEKSGGHLLFEGTPEEMAKQGKGYTAEFLKGKLAIKKNRFV